MNLQRLGNSLTGFGAGDLWAVINYSCRDSCTVRFSSRPAVADIMESQPDTLSRAAIFAPETLGVIRALPSQTLFRLAAFSQRYFPSLPTRPEKWAEVQCLWLTILTWCSLKWWWYNNASLWQSPKFIFTFTSFWSVILYGQRGVKLPFCMKCGWAESRNFSGFPLIQ